MARGQDTRFNAKRGVGRNKFDTWQLHAGEVGDPNDPVKYFGGPFALEEEAGTLDYSERETSSSIVSERMPERTYRTI